MSTNGHAIVTKDLRKAYVKGNEIVKGLDMHVPKGSVYALLGENGVGKTTSIRMIVGQLGQDSGTIQTLGLDPFKDGVEMKKKMAYVAENQKVYYWMTVNDLIKFVKAFYPHWNDELCEKLINLFSLPRDQAIKDFSRGMQTKAALLAAFCHDPELLVLDDPTMGLDTKSRRDLMSGLIEILQKFDRTVLFSTHIIPEIEGIADHVGIMVDGSLKCECPTDELKSEFREIRIPLSEAEAIPEIPNQISSRNAGDEKIITARAAEAKIADALKNAKSEHFSIEPMTLEDIFLAMTN